MVQTELGLRLIKKEFLKYVGKDWLSLTQIIKMLKKNDIVMSDNRSYMRYLDALVAEGKIGKKTKREGFELDPASGKIMSKYYYRLK